MRKNRRKKTITPVVKKLSRYHLSIMSIMLIAVALIFSVWSWFNMKTRELEKQLHKEPKQKYEEIARSY